MGHRIVVDREYNYRRLEPRPETNELDSFCESQYFELVARGERAPGLRRLFEGGAEAVKERSWLESTHWMDIVDLLH